MFTGGQKTDKPDIEMCSNPSPSSAESAANFVFGREAWKGPRRRQGTIPTVSTSSGTDGSNPAPSAGVTRLQRYCEPLRHLRAPGLSLTGVRLVIPDHALGSPVLRSLSLCTCCRHYPGAATGRISSLTPPSRISLPRYGSRVGLRIVLFEACSAFTRVTACTLALSPYFVTRYPKASAISLPP